MIFKWLRILHDKIMSKNFTHSVKFFDSMLYQNSYFYYLEIRSIYKMSSSLELIF